VGLFLGLGGVGWYNYLFFHSLVELFSIVIAAAAFLVAWNTRRLVAHGFFLLLGIALLAAGSLDVVHTLTYKGMEVFPGIGANLSLQLWIAARALEALSFLLAPRFLLRPLPVGAALFGYAAAVALLLAVILGGAFPICYIEGAGLTPFKIGSEYAIALIFLAAAGRGFRARHLLPPEIWRRLLLAILATAGSELAFTVYASVYDVANMLGHLLKILAFAGIYGAIVRATLADPVHVLFRTLKQREVGLAERTRQLETVRAAGEEITRELDLQTLLTLLTRGAVELAEASVGTLHLWDEATQLLTLRARHGELAGWRGESRHRPGEGVVGTVAQRKAGLVVNDYGRSGHAIPGLAERATISAVLAEPLLYQGRLLGVLALSRGAGQPFTAEDQALVRLFATQAAIALENAQLYAASQAELAARRETEAALRESQARLLALTESTPDIIFVKDLQGRYLLINAAWCALVGMPREAILGRDDAALFPPEVVAQIAARDREALAAGTPQMREDALVLGGMPRTFLFVRGPLVDPRGGRLGLFGVGRDITDRKQAEARLRESEARYDELVQRIPVGVYVLYACADGSMRFEYVSAQCCRILGLDGDAALRDANAAFAGTHPEDRDSLDRANREAAMHLTPFRWEGRHLVGGETKWIRVESEPTALPGGDSLWTGVVTDITTRKQLEEEYLIRSKLEVTGRLVGGIAHDFNNLLMVVSGNLELLDLSGEGARAPLLAEIRSAVAEAHALTQQFIALSQGGVPVQQTLPLDGLLREATALALRGGPVDCDYDLPADLWPVAGNPDQLGQVVRNLVLNAREALPSGGRITVRAENLAGPTPAVRVTIADPGPGIPPANLPRIFDPYFSTKQRGSQRGMGLGLTVARAIVERHGGALTIRSAAGIGTTVQLVLPAAPPAARVASPPVARPPLGTGRVLVMDDELAVRTTTGALLRQLGYAVVLAERGEQALSLYREAAGRGEPFDLVMLDLTVRGGMGGAQTLEALRGLSPAVRVIACSGYGDDPILRDPRRHGFQGALAKPYRLAELAEVVARALGS